MKAGRDEDVGVRRIVDGERPDVGDDREAGRAVHPVDPVGVAAAKLRTDERDEHVRGSVQERDGQPGLRVGEEVEVVSGLTEADEVIISDMRDYAHLTEVKIK